MAASFVRAHSSVLWQAYVGALERRPLLTKIATGQELPACEQRPIWGWRAARHPMGTRAHAKKTQLRRLIRLPLTTPAVLKPKTSLTTSSSNHQVSLARS